MKVFILRHGEGQYDNYCEFTEGVYWVDENFNSNDFHKLHSEWAESTFAPKKFFGKMSNRKYSTIPFQEWLNTKLKRIEYVEEYF